MGQNFLACDREQAFLLPPDARDWLPEGHFAWFVIDAVAHALCVRARDSVVTGDLARAGAERGAR
jgi:hypothetical protein